MIILNLSKAYRGRYRCDVLGYDKGKEIFLEVQFAPNLNEPVIEGNDHEISKS